MRKKYIFAIVNIAVPLLAGGIFYYIFCKDILFVHIIDETLGFGLHFNIKGKGAIIEFIRNYALDGLWAYSLTQALILILNPKRKGTAFCILMTVIAGICLELLQKYSLINGVFDVMDITAEMAGALFALPVLMYGGRINEEIH